MFHELSASPPGDFWVVHDEDICEVAAAQSGPENIVTKLTGGTLSGDVCGKWRKPEMIWG